MGKGSRQRPFDQKKWDEGWEQAFGCAAIRDQAFLDIHDKHYNRPSLSVNKLLDLFEEGKKDPEKDSKKFIEKKIKESGLTGKEFLESLK